MEFIIQWNESIIFPAGFQETEKWMRTSETQLAELAWSATQNRSPQKGLILREMLGAGFSPSLARYVTEKLPVLKTEAAAISALVERLDDNFTRACDLIFNCRGRVVVTGMGAVSPLGRGVAADGAEAELLVKRAGSLKVLDGEADGEVSQAHVHFLCRASGSSSESPVDAQRGCQVRTVLV